MRRHFQRPSPPSPLHHNSPYISLAKISSPVCYSANHWQGSMAWWALSALAGCRSLPPRYMALPKRVWLLIKARFHLERSWKQQVIGSLHSPLHPVLCSLPSITSWTLTWKWEYSFISPTFRWHLPPSPCPILQAEIWSFRAQPQSPFPSPFLILPTTRPCPDGDLYSSVTSHSYPNLNIQGLETFDTSFSWGRGLILSTTSHGIAFVIHACLCIVDHSKLMKCFLSFLNCSTLWTIQPYLIWKLRDFLKFFFPFPFLKYWQWVSLQLSDADLDYHLCAIASFILASTSGAVKGQVLESRSALSTALESKSGSWLTLHFQLFPDNGWTQWLKPVILATQEAEIKRIEVQGQPRQKSSRDTPHLSQ
jgi:hypothetical protein